MRAARSNTGTQSDGEWDVVKSEPCAPVTIARGDQGTAKVRNSGPPGCESLGTIDLSPCEGHYGQGSQ